MRRIFTFLIPLSLIFFWSCKNVQKIDESNNSYYQYQYIKNIYRDITNSQFTTINKIYFL